MSSRQTQCFRCLFCLDKAIKGNLVNMLLFTVPKDKIIILGQRDTFVCIRKCQFAIKVQHASSFSPKYPCSLLKERIGISKMASTTCMLPYTNIYVLHQKYTFSYVLVHNNLYTDRLFRRKLKEL